MLIDQFHNKIRSGLGVQGSEKPSFCLLGPELRALSPEPSAQSYEMSFFIPSMSLGSSASSCITSILISSGFSCSSPEPSR